MTGTKTATWTVLTAILGLGAALRCTGGDGGGVGTCTTDDQCPGGRCIDGRCVMPGSDADADVPGPSDDGGVPGSDGDADVVPDGVSEGGSDGDGDGDVTDPYADADGDTISDADEGTGDADGDTIPNTLDDDSDGDTIPDALEAVDADPRTPPPDSDRDGTPDFLDVDSDGDTITDTDEWLADPDGDTIPAYRDYDSDGDGIQDRDEAGDVDPSTGPADSDGDTFPDYLDPDSDGDTITDVEESIVDTDLDGVRDSLDLDSDADGVSDAEEAGDADLSTAARRCDDDILPDFRDTDSDNDGIGDLDERTRGTDACLADTDGDTVSDLVEITYGSDPLGPGDSPRTRGDFVFVVPYMADPEPWYDTLVFSTALQKADVYFLVDCTGSMGGEIANLRSSIRSTVIPGIIAAIPDSWTGVGQFDDYPISPYGSGSDNSYSNLQSLTSDAAAAQAAADRLPNHYGNDGPESHVVGLWTTATGDPSRTLPRQPSPSCPVGRLGYPCFRSDAVRVIILITDAPFHNGPGGSNAYSGTVGGVTPPTYAMAVAELTTQGIRVIGVNSGGSYGRSNLESVARDTGAVSGGTPMVYDISSSGTGLGSQVINAVQELANNVPIRVDARITDDPGDAVDAVVAFVDYLETNVSGASIWDPATGTTRVCTTLDTGDSDGDGRNDYFPSLRPGTSVCWDIHVKRNETVAALATPQIFRATIDVIGDLFTPLDSRDIYFLVPPVIEGSQ